MEITAFAYAIHGAVLRIWGSHRMFKSVLKGDDFQLRTVKLICHDENVRGRHNLRKPRVRHLEKRLPVPRMSRNCLGLEFLDIGQNLLPIPPAMMTANVCSGLFMIVISTHP